jgi:hypothetical protein
MAGGREFKGLSESKRPISCARLTLNAIFNPMR